MMELIESGRLPNADMGTIGGTIQHIRDIFGRMGFSDREIVALLGAHAVGRCHPEASGKTNTGLWQLTCHCFLYYNMECGYWAVLLPLWPSRTYFRILNAATILSWMCSSRKPFKPWISTTNGWWLVGGRVHVVYRSARHSCIELPILFLVDFNCFSFWDINSRTWF